MIHEIGRELEAAIAAKGCPFRVFDREPTKTTTWGRNRIVIERVPEDKVSAPRFQSRVPKAYFVRDIGGLITIFAQSTVTGAQEFEHERICDDVVDMVLIALRGIAVQRKNGLAITKSTRIPIDDLAKSERVGGVAHQIAFTIERAVSERRWSGAVQETHAIAGMRHRTNVFRQGEDDDNDNTTVPAAAVTACGD